MKAGIRAKLIFTLVLASVLPLTLGLISLEYFGYRSYQRNQGTLYQVAATNLARTLSLNTNAQIEKLCDWTRLSPAARQVGPLGFAQKRLESPSLLDRDWKAQTPSSAVLGGILGNPLSQELREFQKLNPLFGEIFITDAQGLVVAATNKSSDYVQSDELWWQRAANMKTGQVWLEGITFDDSAKIYSLDAATPIRDEKGGLRGVVKGELDASQLFSSTPRLLSDPEIQRDVVLSDGRVLARFGNESYRPFSHRVETEIFRQIKVVRSRAVSGGGWTVGVFDDHSQGRREMIGFAPIEMQGVSKDSITVHGLSPMLVVVHKDATQVLAPVRSILLLLGLAGTVLIAVFAGIGLYVANIKIVVPLSLLSRAARSLAQTARFDEGGPSPIAQRQAREVVEQCRAIDTRDEIETLADDFALMGERVLLYHQELEREITAKTGEIQRDLQMAREFQEALLPRDYPRIPDGALSEAALRLRFHHVYEPTLSVGGDFFDVFKLSDHQAGIFIADVMGHGARSALVTAILRTLLQDLSLQKSDPAELMRLVNQHFFDIVQNSHQFVFVSAFCLIIDAENHIATYASAGHPSPLVAEAQTGRVLPLLGEAQAKTGTPEVSGSYKNVALGVARDASYDRFSHPIIPGDAFLLYTDGVVEAPNVQGEEFGTARLEQLVQQKIPAYRVEGDVTILTREVMNQVMTWMQGVPSPDDICLVAVGTSMARSEKHHGDSSDQDLSGHDSPGFDSPNRDEHHSNGSYLS